MISSSAKTFASPLYQNIYEKLCKTDIDYVVKHSSILAAANVITVCHNVLSPE